MKIAILGTRGIPARYGGFETLADQLSKRLAARGHQVTVYCRRQFTRPDDQFDSRIRRVILPSISSKHFDTALNGFLSALHGSFSDTEVMLICNVANSLVAWIPRLFGKPTALHVDGFDRKRRKWNIFGRAYLLFCETLSSFTPSRVVTDALAMQDYYQRRYHKKAEVILYGAEVPDQAPEGETVVARLHLPRQRYILYASRFEPENNPELVVNAYRQLQTEWPLVMLGGNVYDPAYVEKIQSLGDDGVIFTGPIYGEGYWELQKNAGLFVFACEVGGVHPALVEAMTVGKPVLYLDTPENRETIGDCGVAFQPDAQDLAVKIGSTLQNPQLLSELSARARERAEKLYRWDEITSQYEAMFKKMLGRS